MNHAAVILAAFMATLVVRKLPVIRGLVARGVKPFACDVCCASWLALFFRLDGLSGCLGWPVAGWLAFVRVTAALAAGCYLLLRAYRLAEARWGMPDLDDLPPDPSTYQEPHSEPGRDPGVDGPDDGHRGADDRAGGEPADDRGADARDRVADWSTAGAALRPGRRVGI